MAYLNGSGLAHYDEKIKEYIGSHGGSAVGSQITGYGNVSEPYGGMAVFESTGGPVAAMSTGSFYQNVAMYVGSMLSGGDIQGFQAYGGSTVPYVGVSTGSNGPVYMMSGSAFIDYVGSQITPPTPKGSQITDYRSFGQTSLENYYNVAISQTTGSELKQMPVEYFAPALTQFITGYSGVSTTGDVAKVGVFTYTGSPLFEVTFDTFRSKMETEMGTHISTMVMTATGGDQVVFLHSGSFYCMDVTDFLNIQ